MTDGLAISPDLTLPLDTATRRLAVLAMPGAGKSNAAVATAEAMYDAGIPWFAIDPKGDWWGVRSSADGKKPGLSVPIFGGLHGDIQLEPTAGKIVAETIAKQRLSCVVDVSEFDTRQKMFGFLADFAATLLRLNREPLHGFLDECDQYLPQRPGEKGELPRCLGTWERYVRQGRFRGLGATLISQRSAVVNKNVLYMVDCLIALRTFAPGDRNTIKDWLEYVGGATVILETLSSLKDGEAWVFAPAWLEGPPVRIRFNRRRTYDSGRTPKVGESITPPSTLADIDLAALGARMAETVERQRADDPKVLRAEIARLQRELAERPTETVEVPVPGISEAQRRAIDAAATEITRLFDQMRDPIDAIWRESRRVNQMPVIDGDGWQEHAIFDPDAPRPVFVRREMFDESDPGIFDPDRAVLLDREIDGTVRNGESYERTYDLRIHGDGTVVDATLKKGARRMLATLAAFPMGLTREQLGTLSNVQSTGGTFSTYLSDLRQAGYIDEVAGQMRATPAGQAAADGSVTVPRTTDDVVQAYRAKLRAGAQRMLDVLVGQYPNWIARPLLGEKAGVASAGGTFSTYLSALRRNGLIEEDGQMVRAGPALYLFERQR